MTVPIRARSIVALALALALLSSSAALVSPAVQPAQIVKRAACEANRTSNGGDETAGRRPKKADDQPEITCEDNTIQGFVKAARALVNPAIVAMIAVAPLACIVGAAALMFGSRRGLPIIGAALGSLVFMISIRGIVE